MKLVRALLFIFCFSFFHALSGQLVVIKMKEDKSYAPLDDTDKRMFLGTQTFEGNITKIGLFHLSTRQKKWLK